MPSSRPSPTVAEVRRDAPLTCAAVHASQPWLATGSMRSDSVDWTGQVVVWDLQTGQAVSVSTHEDGFGFEPSPRMLQWSPDERRLGIAAGTNEVAVIQPRMEPIGFAPDETRDHPVEFCWHDDRTLFAAAWCDNDDSMGGGALLSTEDRKMRWLTRRVVPVVLKQPVRARAANTVVGHDHRAVFVIDPMGQKVVSQTPPPSPYNSGRPAAAGPGHGALGVCAPPPVDQRYDRSTGRDTGGRTELVLFQSTTRALGQVEVPGAVVALCFAPDERRFVVVSRTVWDGPSHCTVFEGERKVTAFEARLARAPHHFPDASSLVWSPDGEHLALLRADSTIEITSVGGQGRASWATPKMRGEAGLMFANKDRVVLISQHGMNVFDLSGRSVMRFEIEQA